MVTITDYKNCISQEGKEFFAISLQGDVTVATSKDGNFYLTANKALIPTSFNEKMCQTLIGKELSGSIQKVPCESYEFTRETGETVTLNHRYQYSPKEESTAVKQSLNPMEVQQQQYQQVPFMPAFTGQVAATA
jgi:hypothetical protein